MSAGSGPRIIVALDFAEPDSALAFVRGLDPARCRLKIGKELFTRAGPEMVREMTLAGFDVFLDLKFHDIPNTVGAACAAAAALRVWMLNVHALGGRAMMRAAREQVDAAAHRPLLVAVTLLTSMAQGDLEDLGLAGPPQEAVLRLARLAEGAGMDGVVCSPQEVPLLRAEMPRDFRLVTPGIRPAGIGMDDQVRIATPASAVRSGADYLVIGRPVTRAPDPARTLAAIEREINEATDGP
ncbi:MAG: Orotidine 5'-phosphate decarboxylase [Gammaproteobacteria bacterium]|nr:Orotidine 5'-phosphate decarboxylase [Gammaproteobacteria bacterium]